MSVEGGTRSISDLETEMKAENESEGKKCKDCGIYYCNTDHKLTHMDQSKLEKFTCETCGKQFGFYNELKKHKRLHRVERDEVLFSNNLKLEVLGNSEEIGVDKMAKLVGSNKSWGHDEGRLVFHQTLEMKKEVVNFALKTSVTEAEKKYNIEESTIRSWRKKLKKCDYMWEDNSARRKDYIQQKYSAQVLIFLLFVCFLFVLDLFVILNFEK